MLNFSEFRAERHAGAERASAAQVTHPEFPAVRGELELLWRDARQHEARARVAADGQPLVYVRYFAGVASGGDADASARSKAGHGIGPSGAGVDQVDRAEAQPIALGEPRG